MTNTNNSEYKNIDLLKVLDEGSTILKNIVMTLYQTSDKNIYESMLISQVTAAGTTTTVNRVEF